MQNRFALYMSACVYVSAASFSWGSEAADIVANINFAGWRLVGKTVVSLPFV